MKKITDYLEGIVNFSGKRQQVPLYISLTKDKEDVGISIIIGGIGLSPFNSVKDNKKAFKQLKREFKVFRQIIKLADDLKVSINREEFYEDETVAWQITFYDLSLLKALCADDKIYDVLMEQIEET